MDENSTSDSVETSKIEESSVSGESPGSEESPGAEESSGSDEATGSPEPSKRFELLHKSIIFQLKLMTDGLRDLVLVPVSLFATLIGLVRGGDKPEREFEQVIGLGRQSEQWINLFGNHDAPENAHPITSIDSLFIRVEDVIKQQYKSSGISERAKKEIDKALQAAHEQARIKGSAD